MNLIEQLKAKLAPSLSEVTLKNGVTLFVRKPSLSEFDKCNSTKETLVFCVCDETGYTVFADGEVDGKVDINTIDAAIAAELFDHCLALWKTGDDVVEEVEKK